VQRVVHLDAAAIAQAALPIPVPRYDRGGARTGVVHIGVGGFHRAHQAWYHDRLLGEHGAADWAICGVGVMAGDARMRDALAAQDGLYTLLARSGDGTVDARVVGSLTEYRYAPDDAEGTVEKLADAGTRIVSLTITEGGYNIDDLTRRFDADDPGVVRDLAAGAIPRTVFGIVVEALRRRRERGLPPFTVMSCDNLQGNGDISRVAFAAFARLRDPNLGDWVLNDVAFPNSMVDRITPAATEEDRDDVASRFGIDDRVPVVCEPFAQWVLEDTFSNGRPPYELVGVQLVDDVAPYELMKLRLLNAGHQALCYLAALHGHAAVAEAIADPPYRRFVPEFMRREAAPTLPPVPGIDVDDYIDTLIERFSNPYVGDTLARLATDGSDRIPKFVLPILRRQLETGGEIRRTAAVVAGWARYAQGVDDRGASIDVVDRAQPVLSERARRQRTDPRAFVDAETFGALASEERFLDAYDTALASLYERGARATAEALA
jgi:mannitol 2-dehydrogenase